MDDKYNELSQEIKGLHQQVHNIDKTLEKFMAVSNKQHEHIEQLLKDNIQSDKETLSQHDTRLDKVEDAITKIESENQNRKKNHNIIIGISATAATIFAVIIGAILDHFLFK